MPMRAEHDRAATTAVGVARIRAAGTASTIIAITRSASLVKNSTMPAIIRIVGAYQPTYLSISRMIGALVCSACRINFCTRPSVVSRPARVTRTSSTPVRLVVPL